jgi:16S rRNA U516 pseudouridylate synthase RsuA-like enzyme
MARADDCHDIEVSYRDLCELIEKGRVKIDKQITVELGGSTTIEEIRELRDKLIEEVDNQTDILINDGCGVEDDEDDDDENAEADGEEGEPDVDDDEDDEDVIDDDEEDKEAGEVG